MQKNKSHKISELERLSKQILTLKESYRQRRPIVIEICGCPKSGKTSCINTLNIFLKRNGFKTSILTERASVCPVPNKYARVLEAELALAGIASVEQLSKSSVKKIEAAVRAAQKSDSHALLSAAHRLGGSK